MSDDYWIAVDRDGHFGLFAGNGPPNALRCDLRLDFAELGLRALPVAAYGGSQYDVYRSDDHAAIADDRVHHLVVLSLTDLTARLPAGAIALTAIGGAGVFVPSVPAATLRELHAQGECARCWRDPTLVDREGRTPSDDGVFVYRRVGEAYERSTVPSEPTHFHELSSSHLEADARALTRCTFDGRFMSARRIARAGERLTCSDEAPLATCPRCKPADTRARGAQSFDDVLHDVFDARRVKQLTAIWKQAWR